MRRFALFDSAMRHNGTFLCYLYSQPYGLHVSLAISLVPSALGTRETRNECEERLGTSHVR